MKRIAAFAMLFVLLGSVVAVAGDNPYAGKISKFIMIESEQVKPGHEMTFHKVGVQFIQAATTTCSDCYWLAAAPITGGGGDYGFLMFPNSWADIDKMLAGYEKVGRELVTKNASFMTDVADYSLGTHFAIYEFQPELSYQIDKFDPPHVTRWEVTTFQLRPGMATTFTDLVKEAISLHKQANDANGHWLTYRMVAGASGPAFMMVNPMKSLAEMDEETPAALKALLTPLMRKHFDDIMQKAVVNMHTNLYMADPSMSRPPQSYVAANPDFWQVNEAATPVVAKGKKAKKAAEPAAQKETEKK